MEKINILYIIDSFEAMCGAEHNLYDVVTKVNKEKFRPIVFALKANALLDIFKSCDIEYKNLNIKKIYNYEAIKEGIKLIQFIKIKKIKIVITYHEGSDFWGGFFAKLAGIPILISNRRDMGYKLKNTHIYLYKLVNRLFDAIITVSDSVKKYIIKRENAPKNRVETIYNGVDIHKFDLNFDSRVIRAKINVDNESPIIGIIANIRPIKGHKYFLEAASLILKDFPKVSFLIVGSCDNYAYVNELKEIARKLNIYSKITFTGEYTNIAEILSVIDISVFSSNSEGFSNAILESMAARKPVVATNTGGTPEAVIDGITGFLVEPKNSLQLANAIIKLLNNNTLAKNMGESGRKRVESFFSLSTMICRLEQLYENKLFSKTIAKC